MGETKKRGATRAAWAESVIVTVVPSSVVGRGDPVADAIPVDRFVPNEDTIASAANDSIWPAVDSVTVKGFGQPAAALTFHANNRGKPELLTEYRQAALKATEDIENAMMELAQAQARLEQLQDGVASLTRTRDLSERAYKAGAITLTDVLDADRQLLVARDEVESTRADAGSGMNPNSLGAYRRWHLDCARSVRLRQGKLVRSAAKEERR